MPLPFKTALSASLLVALAAGQVSASSHREAPFTAAHPKIDGADFYMFRSYEAGRDAFVTLIADYIPLQDAYGGPNYFRWIERGSTKSKSTNQGDEGNTSPFSSIYRNLQNAALNIGGKSVPVPLVNIGPIGPSVTDGDANKNLIETYTVTVVQGDHRHSNGTLATNLTSGGTTFRKPFDNIGSKSITDYPTYANNHIFSIGLPDAIHRAACCGQRKDPFSVNLGEMFDLVNLNPVGSPSAKPNAIGDKNVTSIALEVPIACLTKGNEPVIGGVDHGEPASRPRAQSRSRRFVGSGGEGRPTEVRRRMDAGFASGHATGERSRDRLAGQGSLQRKRAERRPPVRELRNQPDLAGAAQVLFGVQAPATPPRSDLVAVFLTGVSGLNRPQKSPVGNVALEHQDPCDPHRNKTRSACSAATSRVSRTDVVPAMTSWIFHCARRWVSCCRQPRLRTASCRTRIKRLCQPRISARPSPISMPRCPGLPSTANGIAVKRGET